MTYVPDPGPDPADVELVIQAIRDASDPYAHDPYRDHAHSVLTALAAAGRLLPTGQVAENVEWRATYSGRRGHDSGIRLVWAGCADRAQAERHVTQMRIEETWDDPRAETRTMRTITAPSGEVWILVGPWVAVDEGSAK